MEGIVLQNADFRLSVASSIHSRDICEQSVDLSEIMRTVDFECVNIRRLNCVVRGPKFTHFYARQQELL